MTEPFTYPKPQPPTTPRRWFPLEFGCFGTLAVRTERVRLGLSQPLRILYASDLHLGHWWTARLPGQLIAAARQSAPDVILLGGDLADAKKGLPRLERLVKALASVAPVGCVPGNHDLRPGVEQVQAAVESGGAFWLPDNPWEGAVRIDGAIERTSSQQPRLLCAHYPSDFTEAAEAGYRLVLAGHLHGGQCVLFNWEDKQYPGVIVHRWHGLRFTTGATTMFVSRGAADTMPVRFNCPREVLVCEVV
jgi:predicted MPP superfamily phosphohydrolase